MANKKQFLVVTREVVISRFVVEAESEEHVELMLQALPEGVGADGSLIAVSHDEIAACDEARIQAEEDIRDDAEDEIIELVKVCSCGRYYDLNHWDRLPLLGYQPQYDENGVESTTHKLEMRNCKCKSTMTIEVMR